VLAGRTIRQRGAHPVLRGVAVRARRRLVLARRARRTTAADAIARRRRGRALVLAGSAARQRRADAVLGVVGVCAGAALVLARVARRAARARAVGGRRRRDALVLPRRAIGERYARAPVEVLPRAAPGAIRRGARAVRARRHARRTDAVLRRIAVRA